LAGKVVALAAALLPAAGVIVRWVAFAAAGVPGDRLRLAWQDSVTQLVVTALVALWLPATLVALFAAVVRVFWPKLTLLDQRIVEIEADMREMEELSANASTLTEELKTLQVEADGNVREILLAKPGRGSLDVRDTSEVARRNALVAKARSRVETVEQIGRHLNANIAGMKDLIVRAERRAEARASERPARVGRGRRIAGRVASWIAYCVGGLLFIASPGFPASVVWLVGVLAAGPYLFYFVFKPRRLILARIWPAVFMAMSAGAIAGGLFGAVAGTSPSVYKFVASQGAPTNGRYEELAAGDGFMYLLACTSSSQQVIAVRPDLITTIVPGSPVRTSSPSLVQIILDHRPISAGLPKC
jgi:hypothetical protein